MDVEVFTSCGICMLNIFEILPKFYLIVKDLEIFCLLSVSFNSYALLCWVIMHTFLSFVEFFKVNFVKSLLCILPECQTAWIQIKLVILLTLI